MDLAYDNIVVGGTVVLLGSCAAIIADVKLSRMRRAR